MDSSTCSGMRDYCTHHSPRTLKGLDGRQHRNNHPHLITASPQPQTARDSTTLVAQLTWFNRCKMVALHTLNCRKPTVANAKFNLHSISTMRHMAVERPQLVTQSGGGHGHLTGQTGATRWRFYVSSELHTRTQIATETQPCHQHPTTATHNHFRTAKNSGTSKPFLPSAIRRFKPGARCWWLGNRAGSPSKMCPKDHS